MALNPINGGWTAASLLPGLTPRAIAKMAPPPLPSPGAKQALMRAIFGTVASQNSPAPLTSAPAISQSVGQKNTNQNWNPFTSSGWVSPTQSGFGAAFGPYGNGGRAGQISNILATGV